MIPGLHNMKEQYHVYIGIAAGILTSIALLPQLIKIIRTKKADDLSWMTLLVLLSGLGIWVWYGVIKKDVPIIITNSVSIIINLLVIIFSLKYRNGNGKDRPLGQKSKEDRGNKE